MSKKKKKVNTPKQPKPSRVESGIYGLLLFALSAIPVCITEMLDIGEDKWFLIRTVDMPLSSLPLPDYKVIAARGPFTVESEYSLMKRHKIDVLVCKASGGDMTKAKLDAARAMGCPVVMIARPNPLGGPRARSVDAVVSWLSEVLT